MKKEFENIFKKNKHEDEGFSSQQRTGKILNKTMSQSLLMSYFYHKIMRK